MIPNDATLRQIEAARPDASTWLSANAGSGKTRVLTDRVARLLLSGVRPERILCLTYTKAAASEMQNRLFKRLGEWSMKPSDKLRAELIDLGLSVSLSDAELAQARTLFARALETPGGLKIQTIHSFCSSILRRFPLEAQVSPQFEEIDERSQTDLSKAILFQMANETPDLMQKTLTGLSILDVPEFTRSVLSKRGWFNTDTSRDVIWSWFGLAPNYDMDTHIRSNFDQSDIKLLQDLVPVLLRGKSTDTKNAKILSSINTLNSANLAALEGCLLFGDSAKNPYGPKIDQIPTADLRKGIAAPFVPDLNDLMQRVADARPIRLSIENAERTALLHEFATVFLNRYQEAKLARGWLDFDDLIFKTRDLLTDRALAQWVLYRLDGGIDHILVDEAQDTSPTQWQVIERLAQEFTSGQGARSGETRTIFVVGDKKQSIYSFQGADPKEFDHMRDEFQKRLNDAESVFQNLTLDYSFRSASAVLQAVDLTFENAQEAGFSADQKHIAFKQDLPGRVDVWPVIEPEEDDAQEDWFAPVDQLAKTHHTVRLAEAIAGQIRTMIDQKVLIPTGDGNEARPVSEGDFMILVQRRSKIFGSLIRACKAAGLNIAGADRLKIGGELAVKDIKALLNFLETPEDDLALAHALRSPLFGWSEQDLYDLAHGRGKKFLWQHLRDQKDRHQSTLAIVDDLRKLTDLLRPYELIERILTRHNGRKNLLARLGVEAEDGIDALLSQAMRYEQGNIPSLGGFLHWMLSDDFEIKRQMDNKSDQLRVMTVHASKGLESPIVILPDTIVANDNTSKQKIIIDEGRAYWNVSAKGRSEAADDAVGAAKYAQSLERDRLLYVAMTRAEKWLIVAGAGDTQKAKFNWQGQIQSAIQSVAHPLETPFGEGLRYETGDWSALTITHKPSNHQPKSFVLEPFFDTDPPSPKPRDKTISPSDLGGAKALGGGDGQTTEDALLYGSMVHLLLEHLPQIDANQWSAKSKYLLDQFDASDEMKISAIAEAISCLSAPHLSAVFSQQALTEVPITGTLAELGNQRIHGTIDRLVVSPDHVLAIDFKTNMAVPTDPSQTPDGILRQMGAYAAALQQIYPSRRIETAILWTTNQSIMYLPHDLVIDALGNTTLT